MCTAISSYHWYLVWPPSRGEESTHTTWHQGPHISKANWGPRLEHSTLKFWHSGRGVIHFSDLKPHLPPNALNQVHVWTLTWPIHDLHIPLCQKKVVLRVVLDINSFLSKTACLPGKHHREQHQRLRVPAPPVHSSHHGTPYHDWEATVTLLGLDARIYHPLPLPAVHKSTTITMKQREAKFITEDTMPPAPEVPHSLHSPPHTAASLVIQSQTVTPSGTHRPIASNKKTCLQCSELTASSQIGGSSPRADEEPRRSNWLSNGL